MMGTIKAVTKAVAAKALYAGALPRFGGAGARTVILTIGISAGVALSLGCGGGGGRRSSRSSSSMRDVRRNPLFRSSSSMREMGKAL